MAKATIPPMDLTTLEIAERLGITSRAVRGLINRGRFPNARQVPGATYLIPYSDFENYLEVREGRKLKRKSAPPKKG